MPLFKRSRRRRSKRDGDDPSVFGEVDSVAGVELGMPAHEVLSRLGRPKNRKSAVHIWGQAAAALFRSPDSVEGWLYELVEQDKSLMVIVEDGQVRTLSLQRLS